MYELIQVGTNSYYIQSPAKIGLYVENEKDVCLIDSGNDKDSGRKVRQILEAHNWRLKAIYNTHSNADHIGGNKYLQGQTMCKIYAPGIDCDFTRHPLLEPSFLYGAFPPKALRHKFLMAQESDVEYLTKDNLPKGFDCRDISLTWLVTVHQIMLFFLRIACRAWKHWTSIKLGSFTTLLHTSRLLKWCKH